MLVVKNVGTKIIKYEQIHYGKPRFRCQYCRRQFVENASRQPNSSQGEKRLKPLFKKGFRVLYVPTKSLGFYSK